MDNTWKIHTILICNDTDENSAISNVGPGPVINFITVMLFKNPTIISNTFTKKSNYLYKELRKIMKRL